MPRAPESRPPPLTVHNTLPLGGRVGHRKPQVERDDYTTLTMGESVALDNEEFRWTNREVRSPSLDPEPSMCRSISMRRLNESARRSSGASVKHTSSPMPHLIPSSLSMRDLILSSCVSHQHGACRRHPGSCSSPAHGSLHVCRKGSVCSSCL